MKSIHAILFVAALGAACIQTSPDVTHVERAQRESLATDDVLAEARQELQGASGALAELVGRRPSVNTLQRDLDSGEAAATAQVDGEIAAIGQARASSLDLVVQATNPDAELVDPERRIYRIHQTDEVGNRRWVFGHALASWHAGGIDPVAFRFIDEIRSRPGSAALPAGVEIDVALMLAGTSNQSAVQPYPEDLDYAEEVVIRAPSREVAGAALAELLVELVGRLESSSALEFDKLRVMVRAPEREREANRAWSAERILDPEQRAELARQLARLDGGRLNSNWRLLVPGARYVAIGKAFGIHVIHPDTGVPLLNSMPIGTKFDQVFLTEELPATVEEQTLGEYAGDMRNSALREAQRGHPLKAARRAFNYFRSIGDLEAMAAVVPVFSSPEALVSQAGKTIEALIIALDPERGTRILTVGEAYRLLFAAADVVEESLPIPPGTPPSRPSALAGQLRQIAEGLRPEGESLEATLPPNRLLAGELAAILVDEIEPAIDQCLDARVELILNHHVRR